MKCDVGHEMKLLFTSFYCPTCDANRKDVVASFFDEPLRKVNSILFLPVQLCENNLGIWRHQMTKNVTLTYPLVGPKHGSTYSWIFTQGDTQLYHLDMSSSSFKWKFGPIPFLTKQFGAKDMVTASYSGVTDRFMCSFYPNYI